MRGPCAVGEKVMEILQLVDGFNVVAQSMALKSPVACIWIPVTAATPGFDRATEIGLLVNPCAVPALGNDTVAGEATKYAVGRPVPLSAIVAAGTPLVVLLRVIDPVRLPTADGENVM